MNFGTKITRIVAIITKEKEREREENCVKITKRRQGKKKIIIIKKGWCIIPANRSRY